MGFVPTNWDCYRATNHYGSFVPDGHPNTCCLCALLHGWDRTAFNAHACVPCTRRLERAGIAENPIVLD